MFHNTYPLSVTCLKLFNSAVRQYINHNTLNFLQLLIKFSLLWFESLMQKSTYVTRVNPHAVFLEINNNCLKYTIKIFSRRPSPQLSISSFAKSLFELPYTYNLFDCFDLCIKHIQMLIKSTSFYFLL